MIGRSGAVIILYVIAFIFCCFEPVVSSEGSTSAERPNIIFALADDVGWDGVEYNGGDAYTPNLNEMSQSSGTVRLQRHYSGAPVCSPTRGTVLTGRNHNRYCLWGVNSYSPRLGDFQTVQEYPLPLTEISVAKALKTFGYSTACFGKWHLGNFKAVSSNSVDKVSHPGLHGFDEWWATESAVPTSYPNCGCTFANMATTDYCLNAGRCANYHSNDSSGIISWPNPIVGEDALFIWELAETFIREQVNLQKPFFLYLPFHNVHVPVDTTSNYTSQYDSRNISEDDANYLGSISALDDAIGRLRNLLKELNIHNNTIFWFTGDNGAEPEYSGKLRDSKRSLYEGGIRVPGLIEWPDVISENRISNFSVVTSDLVPTVYDILETEPNETLDGISLLPFLQGKINKRNESIFWGGATETQLNRVKWKEVAIASGDYKLIAYYEKLRQLTNYELFNLKEDEEETTDLTQNNDTFYESIAQGLLDEIQVWQESVEQSSDHCR